MIVIMVFQDIFVVCLHSGFVFQLWFCLMRSVTEGSRKVLPAVNFVLFCYICVIQANFDCGRIETNVMVNKCACLYIDRDQKET